MGCDVASSAESRRVGLRMRTLSRFAVASEKVLPCSVGLLDLAAATQALRGTALAWTGTRDAVP